MNFSFEHAILSEERLLYILSLLLHEMRGMYMKDDYK